MFSLSVLYLHLPCKCCKFEFNCCCLVLLNVYLEKCGVVPDNHNRISFDNYIIIVLIFLYSNHNFVIMDFSFKMHSSFKESYPLNQSFQLSTFATQCELIGEFSQLHSDKFPKSNSLSHQSKPYNYNQFLLPFTSPF